VFSAASNATIKRERYLSAKTSKSSLPHTAIRSRAHLHHRCARAVLAEDVIADTDPAPSSFKARMWQDRHDGADDGRDRRTANHKSSAVNSNSVRLLGHLGF
jgi:hypothetical protein